MNIKNICILNSHALDLHFHFQDDHENTRDGQY